MRSRTESRDYLAGLVDKHGLATVLDALLDDMALSAVDKLCRALESRLEGAATKDEAVEIALEALTCRTLGMDKAEAVRLLTPIRQKHPYANYQKLVELALVAWSNAKGGSHAARN